MSLAVSAPGDRAAPGGRQPKFIVLLSRRQAGSAAIIAFGAIFG
jgi:hypothetical protein